MAKRRRVHPLVGALTLAPLAAAIAPSVIPALLPTTPSAIGLVASARRRPHKPTSSAPSPAEAGSACTLPFDAIKQSHAIDSSCGTSGNSTSGPQAAQNEAKNNFCAAGTPVNLTFANFAQLQQAAKNAGITFGGNAQLPQDRSLLHNLVSLPSQGAVGEGSVVRLAAFVMDAHYSNVSKGESVNCGQPGNENNDIHIVLGQNPIPAGQKPTEAQECASVTAEISPHFRPDAWTPGNLNQNNAHLFRFTGQLFFDAAHRPCTGNTGASPRRVAIWEIHPAYAVDICGDSSNKCTVDSDQNWIPLSDFVGSPAPSNETRLRLPDLATEFSPGGSSMR